MKNAYLTISIKLEGTPSMEDVLNVIQLYEKHEIANMDSFEGARSHVLEGFENELDEAGQFIMSFDPTPAFKQFMNRLFQALYYKGSDEKWRKARGDEMAVGFSVQRVPTDDMIKGGITSPFLLLRVIFGDEVVAELLPLFKKRFATTYEDFLRDVQGSGIKGLMAFGFYTEMPSEL
ncbi:MAG: hypothetical protein GYA24_12670 [Candidatus Lokiarchaeota archaeon]|nr:hypothetical protein [Candidatus Lokiarchaeota archaeon]